MTKTIYLIRGENTESYESFKDNIHKLIVNLVEKHPSVLAKVVLTISPPPAISIIPFKKNKIACITIKSPKKESFKTIINHQGFVGLFEVTEALPVAYNKNWDDGKVTPGVCLLTLFNQKKSIDYNTFIDRWHNSHTPLSLKIHPLTHYDRNVVEERGTSNSENWDGIVEEHCKTKADLLNPIKFFGGALKMIPNMISVYTDTKSFLDYGTIETYLTAEYHIKS
jgi:CRISPR/Cas system CMR-associated protein Cmr5 small subunit